MRLRCFYATGHDSEETGKVCHKRRRQTGPYELAVPQKATKGTINDVAAFLGGDTAVAAVPPRLSVDGFTLPPLEPTACLLRELDEVLVWKACWTDRASNGRRRDSCSSESDRCNNQRYDSCCSERSSSSSRRRHRSPSKRSNITKRSSSSNSSSSSSNSGRSSKIDASPENDVKLELMQLVKVVEDQTLRIAELEALARERTEQMTQTARVAELEALVGERTEQMASLERQVAQLEAALAASKKAAKTAKAEAAAAKAEAAAAAVTAAAVEAASDSTVATTASVEPMSGCPAGRERTPLPPTSIPSSGLTKFMQADGADRFRSRASLGKDEENTHTEVSRGHDWLRVSRGGGRHDAGDVTVSTLHAGDRIRYRVHLADGWTGETRQSGRRCATIKTVNPSKAGGSSGPSFVVVHKNGMLDCVEASGLLELEVSTQRA
eukprot:TRINITY_DN5503_c2_g3_i1.p1 TRINITY_DN5503_c2_g3~~TRINITY_DN5503_c2_g3_i1.p1  ORF type:complete len:438 (+),score=92.97 TRINITY_DN5503_c2_g3_i1:95-1408(+)